MYEEHSGARREASLFSIARFGPSSIGLLLFITITAILFYLFSLKSIAVLLSGVGALFFGVKSMERIEVIRVEQQKLVGATCRVVKPVRRGRLGVVKIVKPDGTMGSELWSAESINEIEAGEQARVIGTRSIVLLVDPLT